MLKSLDLEYHNLDPERGLYFGLEQEGRAPRITTDKMVALAKDGPPKNTRAFGRGELVRHLLSSASPGEEETWKVSPPEYHQLVDRPFERRRSVSDAGSVQDIRSRTSSAHRPLSGGVGLRGSILCRFRLHRRTLISPTIQSNSVGSTKRMCMLNDK